MINQNDTNTPLFGKHNLNKILIDGSNDYVKSLYVEYHEGLHDRILRFHSFGLLHAIFKKISELYEQKSEVKLAKQLASEMLKDSIISHESIATYGAVQLLIPENQHKMIECIKDNSTYFRYYQTLSSWLDSIFGSSWTRYSILIALMKVVFNPNWCHKWLSHLDIGDLANYELPKREEMPDGILEEICAKMNEDRQEELRLWINNEMVSHNYSNKEIYYLVTHLDDEDGWHGIPMEERPSIERMLCNSAEAWFKWELLPEMSTKLIPFGSRVLPDANIFLDDREIGQVVLSAIKGTPITFYDDSLKVSDVEIRQVLSIFYTVRNHIFRELNENQRFILNSTDLSDYQWLSSTAIIVTNNPPEDCSVETPPLLVSPFLSEGGLTIVKWLQNDLLKVSIQNQIPLVYITRFTEAVQHHFKILYHPDFFYGKFTYADEPNEFYNGIWTLPPDTAWGGYGVNISGKQYFGLFIETAPNEFIYKMFPFCSEAQMRFTKWIMNRFKSTKRDVFKKLPRETFERLMMATLAWFEQL